MNSIVEVFVLEKHVDYEFDAVLSVHLTKDEAVSAGREYANGKSYFDSLTVSKWVIGELDAGVELWSAHHTKPDKSGKYGLVESESGNLSK